MHAVYEAALFGFTVFVLLQINTLIHSPVCVYCGKQREHARDCPERDK